ncbi:MAG TPA: hypothetical protein PKX10_06300 [Propioniciclava tarda]|nr:hypothetical protein [Propioniciclava tarda]HQA31016.1 hypothetical protein [Propioniciclava tarda]HQD60212.1 hypothetical protein [Propioniciclava tarda]
MKTARCAVAAVSAVLALTGCATSAGDAAVVDGVPVSISDVSAAAKVASPLVGQSANDLTPTIVQAEIQGVIAQKIAAAQKIELSDVARAEVFKSNGVLADLAATADGKQLAVRLADTAIVAGKLDPGVFAEQCSTMSVAANPRYGVWSKELCGFESAVGSLSKPAPTPTTKG